MTNPPLLSPKIKKIRLILGICLIIVLVVYGLTSKVETMIVTVDDAYMTCSYSSEESHKIQFQEINSIYEISELDFGRFVSGIETERYKFGVWENERFGEYNLCGFTNVPEFIVVETGDRVFVLNFESTEATQSFYRAFMELLESKP